MGGGFPCSMICQSAVSQGLGAVARSLPGDWRVHAELLTFGPIFQVEPFASLSEAVRKSVPRVLINRDVVGPLAWCPRSRDVVQLGDLVHSVEKLVELLGWTEEMKDLLQRETGKVGC